jgi:alanyl-tRNA synthetase
VLRNIALDVKNRVGENALVALGGHSDDKAMVLIACGSGAIQEGVRAGEMAKLAAQELGGGGGGKPDLAQAGGSDARLIDRALQVVRER